MTFPAQSPDLRRFPLVAGASRSVVRSPRSAAPRIRFLFVDSRVRFTLRSAYASRRTPCASLRSLRPGSGRTFTSKSSPMPGPPQRKQDARLGALLVLPPTAGSLRTHAESCRQGVTHGGAEFTKHGGPVEPPAPAEAKAQTSAPREALLGERHQVPIPAWGRCGLAFDHWCT